MSFSAPSSSRASSGSLPILATGSWHDPLTPELLQQLSELLPEFLVSRRWFRAKARQITGVSIEDVIPFAEFASWLLVLDVRYAEGEGDRYLLPVSLTSDPGTESLPEGSELFAALHANSGEKGVLHSAFANPRFRSLALEAIAHGHQFEGVNGIFVAARTELPDSVGVDLTSSVESFVSRAEQSNTSIIFGDRCILKLFRKVESGINPDIEVGKFLTEHNFANTPAVLGTLEYRSKKGGEFFAAGILQKFVRNEGDAWKYTLDELSGFFQRALSQGASLQSATLHPLEQMKQRPSPEVQSLIGPYLESAALLGKRTAEMHTVLASDADDPEFAPAPFTAQDGAELYREMLAQADIAFSVLKAKAGTLQGVAAEHANKLIEAEQQLRDRFSQLKNSTITAQRIRFHGDYHLGQVLFTGSDFMIIDFEGEPARPLSQRREKTICLRDVAGMVRSFQYAGYASLFGQVPGLPGDDSASIEAAAALWNSWISASYLQGYFSAAQNASFLPQSEDERRHVLDAFLLHKALYEVAYELNNRPDWVIIPLRGILSLLQ